jgi:hypothetical protein
LLVGLCAASTLLAGFIRKPDIEKSVFAKKVILPLILTCSATGAWIGYYNFRVTGNIFRLPYQVHEATYGVLPLFLWQKPAPTPQFRHARFREFHTLIGFSAYNQKRPWKVLPS